MAGPGLCHGCYAEEKNGSAASELRCRCAWLHHGSGPRAHRIQGCGAIDPRPKASSPLIAIPTAPSVPSCSKLSRYGLARAEHATRLVRRPTFDSFCARRHGRSAGRDEETAFGSNKCVPKLLDKQSPIQGTSGSNSEAESTDAPGRGGLLRSSDEAGVMLVERRERAIAIGSGQPATGGTRCSMEGGSLRAVARAG